MKFNRIMKIKNLSIIIVVSLILGTLMLPLTLNTSANSTKEPQTSRNYLEPISILIYTEYADTSAGGEYENTLDAIDTYYGTNYNYDELKNYNNLGSELSGYDVLLIPEQETATETEMKTVGQAWSSELSDFANNGGIIICLDWSGPGNTRLIYNSSSVMKFNEEATSIIGHTINLNSTSDPLTRGVSNSWTAPNGAVSVNTTDGTIVVDDGIKPVVVHKSLGEGDIVYCGFDFFNIEGNCSTILANAIRLARSYTPYVIFDDSHTNEYEIDDELQGFKDDLLGEGFGVLSMDTFSRDVMDQGDVLVVARADNDDYYNVSETDIIEDFVDDGGGLLVCTDYGRFGWELDNITERFGIIRNKTASNWIEDSDDYDGSPNHPIFSGENIGGFFDTSYTIQMYWPTGLETIPSQAQVLLSSDNDNTVTWNSDNSAAKNVPLAVALEPSSGGRVITLTDATFMRSDADADSDGTNDYYEYSNGEFLVDCVIWLSEPSSDLTTTDAIPGFPFVTVIVTAMASCAVIIIFIYRKRK